MTVSQYKHEFYNLYQYYVIWWYGMIWHEYELMKPIKTDDKLFNYCVARCQCEEVTFLGFLSVISSKMIKLDEWSKLQNWNRTLCPQLMTTNKNDHKCNESNWKTYLKSC